MALDLNRLAIESLADKVRTNFIEIDGVFLPEEYKDIAEAIENFEVRDDDVWVCSFQKSGTTWTQEMVWNITHDLDFESAKPVINDRFPFLEFSGIIAIARVALRNPDLKVPSWITNSIEHCRNLPVPRYIKSHLPFNLLPKQIRTGEKKPKIVYISRNPKDVLPYAPYWKHVFGFLDKKNADNILLLTFEDMKSDLASVIRKTADFFGKKLNDEQVTKLMDHLSFTKMKTNPSINREQSIDYITNMNAFGVTVAKGEFIRNGNVGQWKTEMSEDMTQQFDAWITKNLENHKNLKEDRII